VVCIIAIALATNTLYIGENETSEYIGVTGIQPTSTYIFPIPNSGITFPLISFPLDLLIEFWDLTEINLKLAAP
jgi:hypothetical protein